MIGRRLREARSGISTLSNPSEWLLRALGANEPTRSGVHVTPETAMGLADVFSCMRALSDDIGLCPLVTYQKNSDGGRDRVSGTPTTNLLANPLPGMTQVDLFGVVMNHVNGWGNAYLAKIRAGDGSIVHLMPMHPARFRVCRDDNAEPVYEVTRGYGGSFSGKLTRRDIIHFKGMSTDGLMGLSPIRTAREAVGAAMAQERYSASFFGNSALPSGILKVAGELSDEAWKRLKDDWNGHNQGVDRAQGTAILEAGTEWQATSITPEDAQFIQTSALGTAKIARIFSVMPWRIGAASGDSMTYSNIEQQSLAEITHSLMPWARKFEATLCADPELFPLGGDTFCEFLFDALLRGDSETRAAVYTKAVWRWMTPNEIRRLENKPPLEDGDKLYPPSAMPKLLEVTK